MLSSLAARVWEHSEPGGHKHEPKAPENHIDLKDNIHLGRP